MHKLIFFLPLISLIVFQSCGNSQSDCDDPNSDCYEKEDSVVEEVILDPFAYDSVYAQELGADEYGMKTYVMAFLYESPNRDLDSTEAADLQRAHLDNINKMAEEGQLVLAGPFYGDGPLRGIYVFNVPTLEEAEALTNSDPAVQAGSLKMELQLWYGSAALMEVNNIHKKIAKDPV